GLFLGGWLFVGLGGFVVFLFGVFWLWGCCGFVGLFLCFVGFVVFVAFGGGAGGGFQCRGSPLWGAVKMGGAG
ncbi:hypothetical protein ACTHRR_11335, partial [Neisseria sp. P0003.S003]|uniref:hypothetical protein n=1 Tax=Neisseria sp. P0003.S003 TaxID=3436658 RepID=UPI003F7E2A3D